MRPQVVIITPQASSSTGFATGLTGAGPFTTFSSPITDGFDHVVTLTSTANLSAITMTIVGTNQLGLTVTEARAGPNNNTVNTTAQFKTITSITAGATLGVNTMDVGFVGISTSPALIVDYKQNPTSLGIGCVVTASASLTYKVQYTYDNAFDPTATLVWWDHATITGKTDDFDGQILFPVRAVRLNLTAWTSGSVTITILQGSSQ